MSTFWTTLIVVLIVAIIVIVILARLYKKATREVSLIRTGLGGQKVIMAGGALALPYFHEISEVNMRTLRLEIKRSGNDSLITKDRLRVDIGASFSVAVGGSEEHVTRAAQTLGERTFNADKLREIIEGKLVDALRAVAAQMSMDELHEGRAQFVRDVRELIADDLSENGLRLQSVSLTSMDQTPFRDLDENNAFNAVGMRQLAEVIAKSKKERAEIDADADVSVRLSAMHATRRKLEIEQDEEQARIAQHQEVETLRAAQSAEIARRRAESEKESEAARIAKEREVREAEITRDRATRSAEITRDLETQSAEIAKERDLRLQQQDQMIAIAKKAEEESKAQAAADLAKADAAKATETIATARQVAEAERARTLAMLAAQQMAESEAERVTTLAKAEKAASIDQAAAARERSQAKKDELLAEAEGQKALVDAENALSDRIVEMKEEMKRLDTLPKALAEMVKPAEKIESIKIHNVTGMGGPGTGGGGQDADKTPVNHALDSILGMAVQLPALKSLGDELGLSMGDGLRQVTKKAPDQIDKPAKK